MILFKKSLTLLIPVALLIGACARDEKNVDPTGENEAITTATLTLTNKATPAESVAATIDNLNVTADFSKATLNLKTNTTYTGVVTLFDKTKTPTLNVSNGIKEEANEHLFVYTFTPATGSPASMTVTRTDRDTNPAPGPYPIGLTIEIRTGAAGTGTLKLVLKHQPATKNGDPAPGTTDLDTDFNVVIN